MAVQLFPTCHTHGRFITFDINIGAEKS